MRPRRGWRIGWRHTVRGICPRNAVSLSIGCALANCSGWQVPLRLSWVSIFPGWMRCSWRAGPELAHPLFSGLGVPAAGVRMRSPCLSLGTIRWIRTWCIIRRRFSGRTWRLPYSTRRTRMCFRRICALPQRSHRCVPRSFRYSASILRLCLTGWCSRIICAAGRTAGTGRTRSRQRIWWICVPPVVVPIS